MSATTNGVRQQLRRRAAARLGRRLIPDSGDVQDLVSSVSASRDRSMILLELPLRGCAPSGAWMPMPDADYLLYPEGASPTRREAVLCHELGHILLKHDPALHASLSLETLRTLAPSLSASTARAMLFRMGYTTDEEAAAEFLGTLLVTALHERRQSRKWETSSRLSQRLR